MPDKNATAEDMSLSRETLSGTIANIVMTVVGFAGTIVFARVLGPTNFGTYFLLIALVEVSTRIFTGWSTATKKRLSEDISESDRSGIYGSQLAGGLILTVIVALLAFAGYPLLRSYVGFPEAPLFFVLLFFLRGVYQMLLAATEADGRISLTSWVSTLKVGIEAVSQLALVVVGLGVVGMALGYAFSFVLSLPVLLHYLNVSPSRPTRGSFESLWAYAQYSIPNSFLGSIFDKFDVILLGALLTPATVGYYEVAFRMALPATFVSTVASSGLMIRVSNLESQGESAVDDIRNTMAFSALLAIPLVFGALVLSKQVIVTFYGPDYSPAATLLLGLSIFQLLRSQTYVLANVANGWDRPGVATRLSIIAIIVNFVLGIPLTLKYGPIGVVFATISAESVRYLGLFRFAYGRLPTDALLPGPIFEQVGAGVLMSFVVFVTLEFVQVSSYIHLIIVVTIGATVYFSALLAVSKRFRKTVRSATAAF